MATIVQELEPDDLKLVLNAVYSISPHNVVNFGLELNISKEEIEGFEIQHNRNMKHCLREILSRRLKHELPLTWNEIVSALRSPLVEENQLARFIESRYLPPAEHAASPTHPDQEETDSVSQSVCEPSSAEDVARASYDMFRYLSKCLSDKKTEVLASSTSLDRLEPEVRHTTTKYVMEISRFHENLIRILEERKEKAIRQLKMGSQSFLLEIDTWKKETKEFISQIEVMEENIKSLSDRDILAQSEAMRSKVTAMELKATPTIPTKLAVPYMMSVDTFLAKMDAGLCTYSRVDPNRCHVSVENVFEVNTPAHVLITLYDTAGFPSSVRQAVSAKILPEGAEETHNQLIAEVKLLSTSRYSATFTPKKENRGHGNIVVQVNQQKIGHSIPIFIECPPQELSHHLQTIDNVMYWGCLKMSGQQVYCNTMRENGQPILARIDGDKLSEKYKLMIPSECKLRQWAPDEFAVNNDLLYVCDSENNKLHCFNLSDGSYVNSTGKRGTELGEFERINGLCVAADSLIYVCDTNNHRIQVFDKDFRCLREFGEVGTEPSALLGPTNVVSVCEGGKVILYVSEVYNHRVQCLSSSGEHIRFIGGPGDGESKLSRPNILHIHHSHIYITDDRGVAVFTLDGQFVARFASELGKAAGGSAIEGLTVTKNGLVYIYHNGQSKIFIY